MKTRNDLLVHEFLSRPVTMPDLAVEFGISKQRVYQLLEKQGIGLKDGGLYKHKIELIAKEDRRRALFLFMAPLRQARNFWEGADSSGELDDCWPWIRCRDPGGYGKLRWRGCLCYAHRVAWMLAFGADEIPSGKFVCHHCDNPPCCNPGHLWLGDAVQNAADRDAKGRDAFSTGKLIIIGLKGADSSNSKLTEEQVVAIRLAYRAASKNSLGGIVDDTLARLSAQMRVHKMTIYRAAIGKTWGHLPGSLDRRPGI